MAGASIACVGTVLPSGRVAARIVGDCGAERRHRSRLAVQAADSTASGTMAVALCSHVEARIAGLP